MSEPKPGPFNALPAAALAPAPGAERADWADIVQQLGAEIAGPLSSALERIQNLIVTGQIDRQSLRALRESVASAREAGMVGQQLARLASGRLQLSRERLHLTQMLRSVLTHRAREAQARGIQIRQVLKPAEVMVDGSLLFALLNALMDWALASTHSPIEMRVEFTPWPVRARLSCRFAHRAMDVMDERQLDAASAGLNSLTWRLVEQTALTMGLVPQREDDSGITTFSLEFPSTITSELENLDDKIEVDQDDFEPSANSKPLAGSHLLIVASKRELRMQVQDAVRHMGLIIDQVGSMDEAISFCQDGLPHGIVFESALRGASFQALFDELRNEIADFSFIEIHKDGRGTQLSTASVDGLAHVDIRALDDSLPSILLFELSKSM
ncbi:MAG: hypothetical protein IV092_23190 [Burkholderiaceae bacterium]|nr:hypothetical protein [Burkholderiaceae bacterium]